MHKTTKALVLREVKYKEADKILTVLTEDEGKLTVSARAVMRKGSKIAAACQLLAFSEMTLFENKGKWYVKEAQAIEQFLGLRRDIESLSLGVYFASLLEAVSDEDSPNPTMLSLGLNSLFALSRNLYPPEHIKAVFELKLMCLSGYEPSLDYCAACGNPEPERPVFSLMGGSLLCAGCPDDQGRRFDLCSDCLAALRHIAGADCKRAFSFSLEDSAAKRLYKLCEAYIPAQLDREFQTLDYWKSVR